MRDASNCSNAVNRMFCRSMVSASSRLRKVVIGGSSSLMPLASVSDRPVASSNDCSEKPSTRSEEQTSELQSLMRTSYAVFCLKKKKIKHQSVTNSVT